MEKYKGIIIPTERTGRWMWVEQETGQVILCISRQGTGPREGNTFFNNLLNHFNEQFDVGCFGKYLNHRVRGVFFDDKNGNIGTVCVDVFHTNSDVKGTAKLFDEFFDLTTKGLDEIWIKTGKEYDMILDVRYFKKEDSTSDYWHIDCGDHFKETKEEIYW